MADEIINQVNDDDGFSSMGDTVTLGAGEGLRQFQENQMEEPVASPTPQEEPGTVIETKEEVKIPDTPEGEPSSETPKEEPKGDNEESVNLFEDFTLEEPKSEASDDGNFIKLREELGFSDVQNMSELKLAIDGMRTQVQAPKYASEEIARAVQQMNDIAAAGGDYRVIQDNNAQVAQMEKDLSASTEWVKTLEYYKSSSQVSEKKQFLTHYYQNELGMNGDLLNTTIADLENKSDGQIIMEAQRAIMDSLNSTNSKITTKQAEISRLKAESDSAVLKAQQAKEAAQEAIATSINEFKDDDSQVFADRTKLTASNAFKTESSTFSMPVGIANQLFATNGVFDVNKALNTINQVINGPAKRAHLEKLMKQKNFRGLKNMPGKKATKTNPVKAASDTSEGGDGFDTVNMPSRNTYDHDEAWSKSK